MISCVINNLVGTSKPVCVCEGKKTFLKSVELESIWADLH